MMTPREQELARLNEAVNLIPDGQKSLFVCLTGADPKDAQRLNYQPFIDVGSKIPATLKDRAMALYKIAGSELAKYPSQVLCFAIEEFLGTTMTEPELADFKIKNPMKFPIVPYKNILEEMADDDPSVAQWLAKQ